MKKVIVISTSLRAGSNQRHAGRQIHRRCPPGRPRSRKKSHSSEKIYVSVADVLACQKLGKCVINDDVDAIMQKSTACRCHRMGYPDLLFRDERTDESTHRPYECNVHPGLPVPRRYMLTVAAEEEPEVPQRAEAGLTGWIDCFPRAAWPVRFSAAE